LFANRPIGEVPDVVIVSLTKPALLKTAKKTTNGWEIPEQAKQDLLNEQAEFEKLLKVTAPDAQVIYRYRMVLNAIAVFANASSLPQIQKIASVKSLAHSRQMGRPQILDEGKPVGTAENDVNSVNFLGAEEAYKRGFTGKGLRIGIIDTGIDFTHKMLGGSGKKEDFENTKPDQASPLFPNLKVVGGVDLVGTDFDAGSPFSAKHQPKQDANPIDEAGHGTHVAGTVAGMGDDNLTYNGVAPDADLYAIKVFGAKGSTNDAAVIAGFEYAADPNGDLNPIDQLNVVNLSLGGGFGQPQILYSEAVRNLSEAGTVIVASAGNSGPVDYIVGAPGTSDEAISVAASVDGSRHNWQFAAVQLITPTNPNLLVKAIEGPISKPISETSGVTGELVDLGLADTDLNEETKQKLQGRVAFIQRGKVSFQVKLTRAFEAGAIGAVVFNNEPGKPIPMGGDGKVEIPAIMISQAVGLEIQEQLKSAAVRVAFTTNSRIEEPEFVDSITSFSSKGPRSEDNLIKPEIAAPGQRVISAAMGQGNGSVQMDGTSMAAPHMAGVMALLIQAFPSLSAAELKSVVLSTSKILRSFGTTDAIPITLQGAGRVQIDQAIQARVVITPSTLSLGRVQVGQSTQVSKTLKMKNITNSSLTLDTQVEAQPGLTLTLPTQVHLDPGQEVTLNVEAKIDLQDTSQFAVELNGFVKFKQGQQEIAHVPALALRTQASKVQAVGTPLNLQLNNASPVPGLALPFNLLGKDEAKPQAPTHESWKSRACDLQSVGYRLISRVEDGTPTTVLQFAFKLYTPVTTWHHCDVSVLFDANGDDVPDQELAGIFSQSLEGVGEAGFVSVLLNSGAARLIRQIYEVSLANGKVTPLNYSPAIMAAAPMGALAQTSIALVEVPLDEVAPAPNGKLRLKAVTSGDEETVEADDYLEGENAWKEISTKIEDQPYYDMSEFVEVGPQGSPLTVKRGTAPEGSLVLYYPLNPWSAGETDPQSQIVD